MLIVASSAGCSLREGGSSRASRRAKSKRCCRVETIRRSGPARGRPAFHSGTDTPSPVGHGHEVLVADCPAEALRVFAGHPRTIDLLLTDVVMPGISGRELAERLTFLWASAEGVLSPGRSPGVEVSVKTGLAHLDAAAALGR